MYRFLLSLFSRACSPHSKCAGVYWRLRSAVYHSRGSGRWDFAVWKQPVMCSCLEFLKLIAPGQTAVLMPSRSPLAIIAAMRPRSRRSNFVAKPAFSWVLATVEESSRTISRRSNSRELDVSTCPALVCSSDRRLPSECEFSASTIRKCSISSLWLRQ